MGSLLLYHVEPVLIRSSRRALVHTGGFLCVCDFVRFVKDAWHQNYTRGGRSCRRRCPSFTHDNTVHSDSLKLLINAAGQRLLPSNDTDEAGDASGISGAFMMFALAVFAVKGFNLSFCARPPHPHSPAEHCMASGLTCIVVLWQPRWRRVISRRTPCIGPPPRRASTPSS